MSIKIKLLLKSQILKSVNQFHLVEIIVFK